MFTEKDIFKKPIDTNIKVWRYMDFTKFVSLINDGSLFFARPDYFEDKFEGSLTNPTFEMLNKLFSDNNAISKRKGFGEFLESFRKIIGINCWHMNEAESAAMWNLYLKGTEGVAVQSTFSKLAESFHVTKEEVSLACVNYVDYETHKFDFAENSINFYELFTHKRTSFAHERELRAIVCNKPIPENIYEGPLVKEIHQKAHLNGGVRITVDLNCLVENIYISPYSASWFSSLVEDSIEKYGYSFPVLKSSLEKLPVF